MSTLHLPPGSKQESDEPPRPGVFSFLYSKFSKRQKAKSKEGNSPAAITSLAEERAPFSEFPRYKESDEIKGKAGRINCHGVPHISLCGAKPTDAQTEEQRFAQPIWVGPIASQHRETSEQESGKSSRSSGIAIEGRSYSDSTAWNFTRAQAIRRNSRCAQEWVRTSTASEGKTLDWSDELQSYSHPCRNQPDDSKKHGESFEVVHKEEGRFRRRSKSARELQRLSSADHEVSSPFYLRKSAEGTRKISHEAKRSSLEAGLDQQVESAIARNSSDKVRKFEIGHSIRKSDFLPSELVQRSLLFNSSHS